MIFYFSGTGNSRYVAEELGKALNEHIVEIGERLANEDFAVALKPNERLGFVFPTYSWGPAPVMQEFVGKMVLTGKPGFVFMVTTCGDDVGQSVDIFAKTLAKQGLALGAAYSVQMPNNYINMTGFDVDPDIVRLEKLHAAPARIAQVAQNIAEGRQMVDVVAGKWAWAKSHIIRPWFLKNAMSDKKFIVDADRCTHCGACVSNCPLHNINLDANASPEWNGHCAMCLSCLHRCPAQAIQYGKTTQNKGRYHFTKQ